DVYKRQIFLFIFSAMPAFAEGEIFVIQSVKIAPYAEALNGFLSAQNQRVKQIILTESPSFNIRDEIGRTKPPLILAIGRDALMNVREIRDIPVIYIMVLSPNQIINNQENFYGISMNVHPEKQMEAFISAIPNLNNIGLIYNPENTGELEEEAVKAAVKKGINLIIRKVETPVNVATALKGMAEEINAFWMFPDVTLLTPESMELLLITSMEKDIPVLTFSNKYLEMGALISVAVDPYDMGLQAGEMAIKILAGDSKIESRSLFARKGVITLNKKVAAKIGIELKPDEEPQ
ncbi:MAG: ABC transporter substrate binding protein, partial [Methanosarcina sp.]|nr:ABC transporter substrate binding protein [Methanosarcina sp.]